VYYEEGKLVIIALCNLLIRPNLDFVQRRYTHLLDVTITLLRNLSKLKQEKLKT
jgi:hypothetical protein